MRRTLQGSQDSVPGKAAGSPDDVRETYSGETRKREAPNMHPAGTVRRTGSIMTTETARTILARKTIIPRGKDPGMPTETGGIRERARKDKRWI